MHLLSEHAMGIAIIAVVALALFSSLLTIGLGRANAYSKKRFLTQTEAEFLDRLEAALPNFRIHAQVAMGALLQVPPKGRGRKAVMAARGRFSQKIVDFVIQSRTTGDVLAVVELDDHTHDSSKDAQRDAMMAAAGYKTIRFHVRKKPTVEQIKQTVMHVINEAPGR